MNNSQHIDYKKVILTILDIIDFAEDKEKFAQQFVVNTQMQAIIDLVDTLPKDKQEEIKQKLSKNPNDPQKITDTINSFFTPEQLQEGFEKAAKNAMMEWMKSIKDSLTDTQKEKLTQLGKDL